MYLRSQQSSLDLIDVGVCRVQFVKINLVELIVELLSKLPRQVVMAESNSHTLRAFCHVLNPFER